MPSTLRLPSGRTLSGSTYGPRGGAPLLLVAGAATGRSMVFGEEHLDRLAMRVITMDRPGMGGSGVDPARTVASTAEDYRRFIAALTGRARLPVVANSQGALFGLAIAATGGAESLTLVSPADEVAHPDVRALLPAHARRLPDLVREDHDAAAQLLGQMSPDAMETMVVEGSDERDRLVYGEPAFRGRYRRALAEGFANDGIAYVQDTLMAMSPWPVDADRIRCPVRILFGADDTSHSPDLGALLAARIPTASREVVDDAGGSLLWTHARQVLLSARGHAAET